MISLLLFRYSECTVSSECAEKIEVCIAEIHQLIAEWHRNRGAHFVVPAPALSPPSGSSDSPKNSPRNGCATFGRGAQIASSPDFGLTKTLSCKRTRHFITNRIFTKEFSAMRLIAITCVVIFSRATFVNKMFPAGTSGGGSRPGSPATGPAAPPVKKPVIEEDTRLDFDTAKKEIPSAYASLFVGPAGSKLVRKVIFRAFVGRDHPDRYYRYAVSGNCYLLHLQQHHTSVEQCDRLGIIKQRGQFPNKLCGPCDYGVNKYLGPVTQVRDTC